jgi:hypothetical protein
MMSKSTIECPVCGQVRIRPGEDCPYCKRNALRNSTHVTLNQVKIDTKYTISIILGIVTVVVCISILFLFQILSQHFTQIASTPTTSPITSTLYAETPTQSIKETWVPTPLLVTPTQTRLATEQFPVFLTPTKETFIKTVTPTRYATVFLSRTPVLVTPILPSIPACASPGKLITPLPQDSRRTKRGGGDAVDFRWDPSPGGLMSGYAYRINVRLHLWRDDTFDHEGFFTALEPHRLLDRGEVLNMVWKEQDFKVYWWVTVIKIEGKNQDGNFIGPNCSIETEHTYFPLFWSSQ